MQMQIDAATIPSLGAVYHEGGMVTRIIYAHFTTNELHVFTYHVLVDPELLRGPHARAVMIASPRP